MAKRIADKELTDRNWDQEEEGEEVGSDGSSVCRLARRGEVTELRSFVPHQAGTFSIASEDVLKSRAIKKAKRRNTGGEVRIVSVCFVLLDRTSLIDAAVGTHLVLFLCLRVKGAGLSKGLKAFP